MKEAVPVELLEKYINGDCTHDEVALVKQWYQSFQSNDDYISGISLEEENALEEKIYNHILNNIGIPAEAAGEEEPVIPAKRYFITKWYAIAGIAASILVLAGVFYVSRQQQKIKNMPVADVSEQQIEMITNNSVQIYKVALPDNSVVWIKPHTQISFPRVFDTKSRMVTISGEGFFEVTKNPDRPFIINSRAIVTKVWGTSFLVRDDDLSNSAEVSVVTGKVSVSVKTASNNGQNATLTLAKGEVMLYPHQKAIYLVDQHILKPETIENEEPLQIWKHVNLAFDNKPLRDIIPVLDEKFHTHIYTKTEKLNHYVLNADLSGFNLPDVLEALKKSLNITYQITDDGVELE
jgi:ferric-dicitrate binding protein FerR (iron transport regulator)